MFNSYIEKDTLVIMIDAIRASASICTAFMNDVEHIVPVSEKKVAEDFKKRGYIIAGERDGEKIKGFDYGNSPFNFTEENIKGEKLAFTTTNGTQVINLVKNTKTKNVELVVGSFININALAEFLHLQEKDILILCSGWKNTVNIEDTLFAGRLIEILKNKGIFEIPEAANLAFRFYKGVSGTLYDFIMDNSPRLKAKSEKLGKDIRYCLTEDQTDVIPYLEGDVLIVKQ